MLYVINFADEKFAQQQNDNCETAVRVGKADKAIAYHPEDIDERFIKERPEIFKYKRGHGLWIWKAYFTLKTLETLNEGDFLLYCDAGSYFVNDIHNLTRIMDDKCIDIMTFELPLLEHQWTKKEVYDYMKLQPSGKNQCLAGYYVVRKTDFSVAFFKEWLKYMSVPLCLVPKNCTDIPNPDDFIAHREDQSVFSLLVHKYRLETFRDPSQFGDWPWLYKMDYASYFPHEFTNSDYSRILVSNRRIPMNKFTQTIGWQNKLDKIRMFHLFCRIRKTIKHLIIGKDLKDKANIQ